MKAFAAMVLAACGASPPATTLTNGGRIAVEGDIAVVEHDDLVFAFAPDKISVIRGSDVVRTIDAPLRDGQRVRWDGAATLALPGLPERSVIALGGGASWQISAVGDPEPLDDQIEGLHGRVLGVAGAGRTFIIGLENEIVATRDGKRMLRFSRPGTGIVAAARDRVALGHGGEVELLDLAHDTQVSFDVDDPQRLLFVDASTGSPHLVVLAARALFVEDGGRLVRVELPAPVREVSAAGSRLWIVADGQLYLRDESGLKRTPVAVGDRGKIYGSRTGDVWVAVGSAIVRYSPPSDAIAIDASWLARVEPIFRASCARCHLPAGDADLDLSTPAQWSKRRDAIIQRVLIERTMPPDEELSDRDRKALDVWLRADSR